MTAVVFAGPSIFGLPPAAFEGVDLRAPAACGDLLHAALEGAQTIGLIDGSFGETASVWHKEILAALDRGVRVFGAASMGALRAAECHAFGMIGIGSVFEEYRSGVRSADADVAVLHAPAELGYSPLTVALVDAEATIAALVATGRIGLETALDLLASARRIGFRDRTWSAIVQRAGVPAERAPMITELMRGADCSPKREDAAALLARLREPRAIVELGVSLMPEKLNRTFFLAGLERRLPSAEGAR